MKKFNDNASGWAGKVADVRVGLDVGDRVSRWAAMRVGTGEVREGLVSTTPDAIRESFAGGTCTVLMEAGSHTPWLVRLLAELGHRPVVVDPASLRVGGPRRRRNDRKDARGLMDLAEDVGRPRVREIWQRPQDYQQDLSLMRLRDAAVRARSLLANSVRGTVKLFGERLGSHSVKSLPKFAREELSPDLFGVVEPLLVQIEQLTEAIAGYDRKVDEYLARRPESARLLQVQGVGPVTTGIFMAVIGDPSRFARSRDVGDYLGLVPGLDQSGDRNPSLRITKQGNELLRRTLVQCAHFIMSTRAEDCDLKRWALKLAGDGSNKTRRKKAAVALARKLAVLLHCLWLRDEKYERFRNDGEEEAEVAAA